MPIIWKNDCNFVRSKEKDNYNPLILSFMELNKIFKDVSLEQRNQRQRFRKS